MIRNFYIESHSSGYYIWAKDFRKLQANGFFEYKDDDSDMMFGISTFKHGKVYYLYDYRLCCREIILSLTKRPLTEVCRFTVVLEDNEDESKMVTSGSFVGSFYDAFLWIYEKERILDGKKVNQGIVWDRVRQKCTLSDKYRDDNYYYILKQVQRDPKRFYYIELTQKQKDTPIPQPKEWSEEEIDEIWQIIGSFYGWKYP